MAITFPLNNDVIKFDWDTVEFTQYHKRFEAESAKKKEYFLKEISCMSHDEDLALKVNRLASDSFDTIYLSFKDLFMERKLYDFSIEKLHNDGSYGYVVGPFNQLSNTLRQEIRKIDEYQEAEEERREFRKETRGRVVGGGFGVGGFVKGAATAGAMNMASGLGHSMFNMVGDAMTAYEASGMRDKVYNAYIGALKKTFEVALDKLDDILLRQLNISWELHADRAENILDNVSNGTIPKADRISALTEALVAFPYGYKIYSKYLEEKPEEEDNLCAIAEHFSVDAEGLRKEIHEFDSVYFSDFRDKSTVERCVNNILNVLDDKKRAGWSNKEYFINSLDFDTIDIFLTSISQTQVDSQELNDYFSAKKKLFEDTKVEMEAIRHDNELHDFKFYEISTALAEYYNKVDNSIPDRLQCAPNIDMRNIDIAMQSYAKGLCEPWEIVWLLDNSTIRNPYQGICITFDKIIACLDNGETVSLNIEDVDIKSLSDEIKIFYKNKELNVASNFADEDEDDVVGHILEKITGVRKLTDDVKTFLYKKHKELDRLPEKDEVREEFYARIKPIVDEKQVAYNEELIKYEEQQNYRRKLLENIAVDQVISAIIPQYNSRGFSNIYIKPRDLPEKKLKGAMKYLKNHDIDSEDVWMVYDSTFFGGADDGFAMTYDGIYSSIDGAFKYKDIKEVVAENNAVFVVTADGVKELIYEKDVTSEHTSYLDELFFYIFHPLYMPNDIFEKIEAVDGGCTDIKKISSPLKVIAHEAGSSDYMTIDTSKVSKRLKDKALSKPKEKEQPKQKESAIKGFFKKFW